MATRNPYTLEPTANPRLLATRRPQLDRAIEAVDDGPGSRHVVLSGPSRSGRTSTLQAACRHLCQDGALVVRLRLIDREHAGAPLWRALLVSTVEALVADAAPGPEWYRAWCDRVHLRSRTPMDVRDALVSGLALAEDPTALPARAILERDLRTLRRFADERGHNRIVVAVDDADDLLEDHEGVEALVSTFDAVGGWSLVVTTTARGPQYLIEATSPVLRRMEYIGLRPMYSQGAIRTCLTAPLDADAAERLLPEDDAALLRDLLHLTAGNPFEIALVGRHLWGACQMGEQEHYQLTPTVLDRVLSELAIFTGAPRELVAGARAVRNLPRERIKPALELVALSELTARQVAIARLLGLPNNTGEVRSDRLLGANVDDAEARVLAELAQLAQDGVVTLCDEGRFEVQGGPAAELALKYQARLLTGEHSGEQPFGIDFLQCVGDPLVADCTRQVADALGGTTSRLSWYIGIDRKVAAAGARLRNVLDAEPFAGIDQVIVSSWGSEELELIATHIAGQDELAIAFITFCVGAGDEELNQGEVLVVPSDVTEHAIREAVSNVSDDWTQVVEAAEMTWSGAHVRLLTGDVARRALMQVHATAATRALWKLVEDALANESGDIGRPVALAQAKLDVARTRRTPDAVEICLASSHLGFTLSLEEDRLPEARQALEDALDPGPADGWITSWVLTNVLARLGDHAAAQRTLEALSEAAVASGPTAMLSFYVPGMAARETVVQVTRENVRFLLSLQRALITYASEPTEIEQLHALIDGDEAPDDTWSTTAREWVTRLLPLEQSD